MTRHKNIGSAKFMILRRRLVWASAFISAISSCKSANRTSSTKTVYDQNVLVANRQTVGPVLDDKGFKTVVNCGLQNDFKEISKLSGKTRGVIEAAVAATKDKCNFLLIVEGYTPAYFNAKEILDLRNYCAYTFAPNYNGNYSLAGEIDKIFSAVDVGYLSAGDVAGPARVLQNCFMARLNAANATPTPIPTITSEPESDRPVIER
jgi:hypothetical protein